MDVIRGPLNIIQGIYLLKKDAIVVKYEELIEDAENTVKAICYKLGIAFHNEMLTYGSKPAPKGRFGDSVGVVKHDTVVPYYIDQWAKNLCTPALYLFSLKYMEILGPDIFNIMGYSYQQNRSILEKLHTQATQKDEKRKDEFYQSEESFKNTVTVGNN